MDTPTPELARIASKALRKPKKLTKKEIRSLGAFVLPRAAEEAPPAASGEDGAAAR